MIELKIKSILFIRNQRKLTQILPSVSSKVFTKLNYKWLLFDNNIYLKNQNIILFISFFLKIKNYEFV